MQINSQAIERQDHDISGRIAVHHMWLTVQGEGPYVGYPAVFVRLAGCNLQCPACDTDYTSRRTYLSPGEAVLAVRDIRLPRQFGVVVITGGEPFRQNITPFVELLLSEGYEVQVETNGTCYLPDFPFDRATVVCSPKTPSIHPHMRTKCDYFKYVLQAGHVDPNDGLPTTTLCRSADSGRVVARPNNLYSPKIYVQPLDEADETLNKANALAAVDSCLRFGYRLCIQTHKLVGLE